MLDINITLLGQFITFVVLVLFTMKYVWPPIIKAIQNRQNHIANGLLAAEKGVAELALAEKKVAELLQQAKIQATDILEHANQRSAIMLEEAKIQAKQEGDRLIEAAKMQISQELYKTKQELLQHVSKLVITGAEKILQENMNTASNELFLSKFINEI